ncbi:MAG: DUF2279 domain-containing protein [Bacteroidia bacterium]
MWYKDHKAVPFHFYNDNQAWLQMDKYGHAYVAYYESSIGYNSLRWAGLDKKKALIWGGSLGLLLQTPVEIFDGLYEGYGFSWGDMAANAAGAGLFVGQELLWDEQRMRLKFSFQRSDYADHRSGILGENGLQSLFLDYNGPTYWLSANLASLTATDRIPGWFNMALGYSANGMLGDYTNPEFYRGNRLPEFQRHRQWLLSPDVDLSKIKTNRVAIKAALKVLNIIKIPAPALEMNSNDGLKFHWFYF